MRRLHRTMSSAPDLELKDLAACRACPRLVAHHSDVRSRFPAYHAAPVGAWGSGRYRLLIVGLAPGLHGAARTGKAFVGDASGQFLFAALHAAGFATHAEPEAARLVGTRITNVVKCLPPGNAPTAAERANCASFLRAELDAFTPGPRAQTRVILNLGGIAHASVCRLLGLPVNSFAHGAELSVAPNFKVMASFHPSRLNVNTRRLTVDMLGGVLARIRDRLDGKA